MPRLDGDAMLTMPAIEAQAGLGMPQDERYYFIAISQEGSSSGKQESLQSSVVC
jgi:hypothetical protein